MKKFRGLDQCRIRLHSPVARLLLDREADPKKPGCHQIEKKDEVLAPSFFLRMS